MSLCLSQASGFLHAASSESWLLWRGAPARGTLVSIRSCVSWNRSHSRMRMQRRMSFLGAMHIRLLVLHLLVLHICRSYILRPTYLNMLHICQYIHLLVLHICRCCVYILCLSPPLYPGCRGACPSCEQWARTGGNICSARGGLIPIPRKTNSVQRGKIRKTHRTSQGQQSNWLGHDADS